MKVVQITPGSGIVTDSEAGMLQVLLNDMCESANGLNWSTNKVKALP